MSWKHPHHLSENLPGHWNDVERLRARGRPLDALAAMWERCWWRKLSIHSRKRWTLRRFVWDEKTERYR